MNGKRGLSILIPIFNYDVKRLVKSLKAQAERLELAYEILCYDDLSAKPIKERNFKSLSELDNVTYKELRENQGRSRIRNLLARGASFENLLFIDCDSKINEDTYLEKYLIKAFSHDVVFGGTEYSRKLSNPEHSLRWKYGRKREEIEAKIRRQNPYDYITFNNIFVTKVVFMETQLDESITSYGHEDTKFGYVLKQKNISIAHIDNPVEHIGLESNEMYLDKTAEGVKNLYKILMEDLGKESRLYKSFNLLRKLALTKAFKFSYRVLERRIERNLTSADPRLFYFDLFKLNQIVLEDYRNKGLIFQKV